MSKSENKVASYAIIGFGNIGKALAKAFARNGIEVSVATTRDPESFASDAAAIGPEIIPQHWRKPSRRTLSFWLCISSPTRKLRRRCRHGMGKPSWM